MQFDEALYRLMQSGLTAQPHYDGVPDPVAQRNVMMRGRNRKHIAQKLRNIVIPELSEVDGFNMSDALLVLGNLIKQNDTDRMPDGTGVGVNIIINQFLTPGAPNNQQGGQGGGQGGGGAQGGGGGGVDPATGLPLNAGGGMMGGGTGGQTIDPITGLPITGAGGAGATGGPGAGLPGAGGALPGVGGGLPGVGGGLPGVGGMPGVGGGVIPGGGGGANGGGAQAAFDPEIVKVRGLSSGLKNLSAKQVLDIVTMSFDHPIQYVIMDQGIVFVQKPASQQGYFTRTFRLNPSAVLGFPGMSGAGGGGGQGGGGQGGGGQGGGPGGGIGGGPGGGTTPGGGPGGPGMGGGPGGGMGGGPAGGPGGGRGGPGGAPQFRQFNFNGGGYNGNGFNGGSYNGRGFQQGNRFNMQPFSQQNFGGNTGFQRFNSFTPGYGQSTPRGRQ